MSSSAERSPGLLSLRGYERDLAAFQDMMVDFLMFGYNVELEGIGTFSVSLKSRPVMEKNEIRAESIHFKDVKFRSSKELRDRLKTMPVFRDEYTVSDPAYPSAKGMRARGIPLSGDEPFYPPEEVYVALRMLQK